MAPSGHKENSNESQDLSGGSNQQRDSIASQSSNDPSLSDFIPADGFRPAADAGSASSPSTRTTPSNATEQAGRSHAGQPSDYQSAFRNRPSSVAKPHRPHESLTLRHEHNNASETQPSFARASIASSEGPVIRPDSPYRGPTGPSHPYQMYPQRTLTDAPSSPTSTSADTPPATQQGPTHPYTLYTQSTAEIEETPSRTIPVGFTNLPDNYRRQIGPDGEEAGDLVGPMGHTEELPPYTRYPEIAYVRKEPSNDTESISTPSSSTPGVPAVASGAGGIGRATRDPEFSSTEEDLPLDRSRPSVRSQSSRASSHDINTAAQEISEKSTRKEKWQRRAKKKLWGIVPYWAICLVMVGMVFMGIIMGAVIGTVLKKSDDQTRKAIAESEEEYPPPPKAPVAEVVPLTSLPDDLDDITVGTWGLPQLDKDEAPRKCFNNSLEFNAWSCDIPFRYYSIDITEIKNASKLANYDLELFAINETDAQFIWGTQPPSVPKPIPLKLVNDTFDMGRGPAWWLNVTYNKTVIVPEANFPLPERRAKRATFDFNEHPASEFDLTRFRKGSKGAVEGDTPWICTWPDTTLEIFIYPNVNASLTETTGTDSDEEADYTQPTPPSRGEYPTKAYPKVVKFLERRLSGNPNSTAVCRQVYINPGGWTWEDKKDEDGEPIRVEIVETSSPWEEQAVANDKREVVREWYGTTDNSLARRDQQELTSCGCLWWST